MDIDYMQVCQELLEAQRQSYIRERRQEKKYDEIDRRFSLLASSISFQRPTEIQVYCRTQELKYENNVLYATITFEIMVHQKSVSLYIKVSVPEDESVEPKLSFGNVDGDTILLDYSEVSEAMIIDKMLSLLSRSDKNMFSRS